MAVEGWRHPPNPALPIAKLRLLFGRIFMEAVGGIRHDRVNAVLLLPLQPIEAVGMVEDRVIETERISPRRLVEEILLNPAEGLSIDRIQTSAFTNKQLWRVQAEIRTN